VTGAEREAMRAWIAETSRHLSTISTMPGPAEIEALPDQELADLVDRHYPGGIRLFRATVRNGGTP
jgi:hypothetical protein